MNPYLADVRHHIITSSYKIAKFTYMITNQFSAISLPYIYTMVQCGNFYKVAKIGWLRFAKYLSNSPVVVVKRFCNTSVQ